MVTAEIAVALPSLVLITAIALWGLTLASVQLTCTDAARTGARAAARGESLDAVRELVVKAVPEGSTVQVSRDQATVRVDVSASVKPPAAAGLAALTVHVHAVAATEPGTEPNANDKPPPTTRAAPARLTTQTSSPHRSPQTQALTQAPLPDERSPPYPGLVSIGTNNNGRIVIDLEAVHGEAAHGLIALRGPEDTRCAALSAIAMELVTNRWSPPHQPTQLPLRIEGASSH